MYDNLFDRFDVCGKHVKVYIDTGDVVIQLPVEIISVEASNDGFGGIDSKVVLESRGHNAYYTLPFAAQIRPDRWVCKYCSVENDKNSGSCEKCGSPKGLSV